MALIDIRDLSLVRRGRELVRVAALTIDAAVPLVILGPSGAGKTSLLRLLLGLVPPSAGTIRLDDRSLGALGPRGRAAWFAWLPQLAAPHEPLPVVDYLAGARFRFAEPRAATVRALTSALALCGVAELADAPISRLSGGELQRAQLAGLIAQETRFLVLDEPANHLDPALVNWLHDLLAERVGAGQGLVAVSHDVEFALALERRLGRPVQLLGLAAGKVCFQCASDADDLPARLEALYGVPWLHFDRGGRRFLVPDGREA